MHPILRWLGTVPAVWTSSVFGQACNPVFAPTPGLSVLDERVLSLHVHDDGGGPALYAGGRFDNAGAVQARRIARWNGTEWSSVGAKTLPTLSGGVGAMTDHMGRLCIAVVGTQAGPCVLQWDGAEWTTLASGKDIRAIASYAGDLYVSGNFSSIGGVSASQIARWDGATWGPLGTGLSGGFVGSLQAFGSSLIAGGAFTTAGGIAVSRIARWDGSWHAMSPTLTIPAVQDLLANESVLFISGLSSSPANSSLVRWDGGTWETVPNSFLFSDALGAWNGDLCAKASAPGSASWAGQVVGCWNGNHWTPIVAHAQGANNGIFALREFQGDLYLGGNFTTIAEVPAPYLARFTCIPATCYPDCDLGGTLNLADFGCFQSKFAANHMYADCNKDFALNLADFGCFQSTFARDSRAKPVDEIPPSARGSKSWKRSTSWIKIRMRQGVRSTDEVSAQQAGTRGRRVGSDSSTRFRLRDCLLCLFPHAPNEAAPEFLFDVASRLQVVGGYVRCFFGRHHAAGDRLDNDVVGACDVRPDRGRVVAWQSVGLEGEVAAGGIASRVALTSDNRIFRHGRAKDQV